MTMFILTTEKVAQLNGILDGEFICPRGSETIKG